MRSSPCLFVNLMLNSTEVEVLSSGMRQYMAGRNLPYQRIFLSPSSSPKMEFLPYLMASYTRRQYSLSPVWKSEISHSLKLFAAITLLNQFWTIASVPVRHNLFPCCIAIKFKPLQVLTKIVPLWLVVHTFLNAPDEHSFDWALSHSCNTSFHCWCSFFTADSLVVPDMPISWVFTLTVCCS